MKIVLVDFITEHTLLPTHYLPAVPLVVLMLMTKGVSEPFFVTTTQTSKYPSSSKRVYTLCSYPTTVTAVIISDVVSG